jgi:GAF domain-containing protein
LDLVNQSISTETNLEKLFRITYEQVVTVMGEVDFLIALYDNDSDTIEIPYAFENGKRLTLPPFPLGEGLTSIIIHKKSPLMLVEDTIHKAADMGAKVVGMPAKSWLGAPMLVGGEAIGAMVVQDLENEKRFDEDDLHLMTNLATQVAITVRNVAQLENAQRQAERERVSAEITSKLWASTDIHTILRTAIQELGRRLEASEGMIQLQSPPSLENLGEPENGKKERAL